MPRYIGERMSTPATAPSPQEQIFQFVLNFWNSRAVYAAATLGIADLLASGAKTAAEIAEATQAHAPSVYRLLRALSVTGVFDQDGDRFSLTPLSELLRSDIANSLRYVMLTELGEEHFPAWGNLMHSVRTGEIAFDNHFGMDAWQ